MLRSALEEGMKLKIPGGSAKKRNASSGNPDGDRNGPKYTELKQQDTEEALEETGVDQKSPEKNDDEIVRFLKNF